MSPGASGTTLGAAFAGFTIGAVLFGITITQAYNYFMYANAPSKSQRISVIIILILDSLHFAFSVHMLFNYLLQISGSTNVIPWVVCVLISLQESEGIHLISFHSLLSMAHLVFFVIYVQGQKIKVIHSFTLEFEYVIYVGFGTTAFIDMGIAAAMCLMLYKSSKGVTRRSNMIVTTLIQYVVGTGLLTSLGALMCMVLYIAKPVSLLYLGVEYSMTKLYAISVLALYNSQSRLREQWNEPADLKGGSMLYFAGPEKGVVGGGSSGQEGSSSTQVTTSDEYTRHYRRSRRHRRRTSSLPGSPEDSDYRPLTRGEL
ncbi:hypothetical protein H1R20_g13984, partial [Candolleomyces eurysporus]